MPTLTPIPLAITKPLAAISERTLAEHYKLYVGYVARYNELAERLAALRQRSSPGAVSELESLKVDITFALGAIKNHEVYFGMLATGPGDAPDHPEGALAEMIKRDFGSLPSFLVDLKHTANASRGWAWTAFDLDLGTLFNYPGTAQAALPVLNVVPILAIDLYGHAYFYDFGNNKTAYIEALLHDIAWDKVSRRHDAALALRRAMT